MDRFTKDKLHLNPRSNEELHTVLTNFERKWQSKVRRIQDDRMGSR
jgi:hypothetical protein